MKKIVNLLFLSFLHNTASKIFEGDGTAYTLNPPSAGNCNYMSWAPEAVNNYAAINNDQWAGLKNCGRCAEVWCIDSRCGANKGKKQTVYILDRCPECKRGDLDLSPTVFKEITGSHPARLSIQWNFVKCPIRGGLKLCLKEGSSPFWVAVQAANSAAGVSKLFINDQPTEIIPSSYFYKPTSSMQYNLETLKVRIVSHAGESIEKTVALKPSQCTTIDKQFDKSSGDDIMLSSSDDSSNPVYIILIVMFSVSLTVLLGAFFIQKIQSKKAIRPKVTSKAQRASSVSVLFLGNDTP